MWIAEIISKKYLKKLRKLLIYEKKSNKSNKKNIVKALLRNKNIIVGFREFIVKRIRRNKLKKWKKHK